MPHITFFKQPNSATQLLALVFFCGWLVPAASLAAAAEEAASGPDDAATVFWTTAERLMPAWRFYPNSSEYGGTKPLGKAAAWTPGGNEGLLTWIADFPRPAA